MKQEIRILVCGSRDWADVAYVHGVLTRMRGITHLGHGDARGADTAAHLWCSTHPSVSEHRYPANWQGMGRGAGPIRNRQMLDDFRPGMVLAFKDDFDMDMRRGGTEHMVKIALQAGVACRIHYHGGSTFIAPNNQERTLFS